MEQDQMLSLLLANEAVRIEQTTATLSQLTNSLARARERRVLSGHREFVEHAAWSPDGTRIVTAGVDGLVLLWNLQETQPVALPDMPPGVVLRIEWSSDSTRFAVASREGQSVLCKADGSVVDRFESVHGKPGATAQRLLAFEPGNNR